MKKIAYTCGLIIALVLTGMIIPVLSDQSPDPLALKEITSDEELNTFLNNLTSHYKSTYSQEESDYVAKDSIATVAPVQALGEMKNSASGIPRVQSTRGAADYSTTNIQVAGVDEADFVKNDGKYIYIVRGNTLSIVQAYPPQTASIVAKESITGTGAVSDLFLSGDRLVVFTSRYYSPVSLKESYNSYPGSEERTHAVVYDISDRSHPFKIREISMPGSYEQARMIGGDAYVLTAEDQGYYTPRMPVIYDDADQIRVKSVWCPPEIISEYRMNTLTSFPVTGNGSPQGVSFLMGWDNTLYVSSTDVFIAYERNNHGWNTGMPGQGSVIHRFAIDRGSIRYTSTGYVPGSLLNQFSLDQYEGNLRVATTAEGNQYNSVYILDPDLKIIGKLEHLAPGEKIYSARFMSDILYLVTFRQTDPLFVIDLSNPDQPGVLGELKIPGYSDYLHPYDRTHLIGIGKDTYENSGGGVVPAGVKIALFDVSDLNNPRLIDSRVIGEKGSDSSVLTDHRAFLLDKERNILALPIKEIIHSPVTGSRYGGSYTEQVWQGTYVFGIDPDRGFYEKGKIRQSDFEQENSWSSGSAVLRSLFMDQTLYTISRDRIVGSDLEELSRRMMDISLTDSSEEPWYFRPLWESFGG